jgi:hypothetical protein
MARFFRKNAVLGYSNIPNNAIDMRVAHRTNYEVQSKDAPNSIPYGQITTSYQPHKYKEWWQEGERRISAVGGEDKIRSVGEVTGKLFSETPPKVTVQDAFFDHRVSNLFPIALGIIQNDYPNVPVVPPTNLSRHSSHVANNALRRGLIPESNEAGGDYKQRNDHDWEIQRFDDTGLDLSRATYSIANFGAYEFTPEEVKAGKQTLRNTLRANRKPPASTKLSAQFDSVSPHPKLPGMEEY